MSLEKNKAQPEAASMCSYLGAIYKRTDHKNCPRCHMAINNHLEPGMCDYHGSIPVFGKNFAYPFEMEVKAHEERLSFNQIDELQWDWSDRWQKVYGIDTWFFIYLGAGRVDAAIKANRPDVYLIPRNTLMNAFATIMNLSNGVVENIPKDAELAKTRVATRDNGFNAQAIFSQYKLTWRKTSNGESIYWPDQHNQFWTQSGLEYREPYRYRSGRNQLLAGECTCNTR